MAQQQELESTTKLTNKTKDISFEEHDLDLSLGLRPLNSPKHLHDQTTNANATILSKRDAQALRRHEAKVKRDLKRKAASFSCTQNGAIIQGQEETDLSDRCRKVPAFGLLQPSFMARPPWLGNAGGFRPYQGQNGKVSCHSEGDNRSSISSGSSSGISDHYHSHSSGQGGNNSDAGSHSSHPSPQLTPPNVLMASTSESQPCTSKPEIQPNESNLNGYSSFYNQREHFTSSRQSSKSVEGTSDINSQPSETQLKDGSSSDKEPTLTPRSPSPKEASVVIGKPPKPAGQMSQEKLQFSQMPCVSTTGNGPKGQTITGFLYKYTKSEVSIVCVCHGASFSPAGFVEHAGGVDVEHPLRHIRVVPFALG